MNRASELAGVLAGCGILGVAAYDWDPRSKIPGYGRRDVFSEGGDGKKAPVKSQLEKNFCDRREQKISGEPRDARKNHGIWPYFERILSKIVIKTQNKTLAKFQILASDPEIDFYSEIKN